MTEPGARPPDGLRADCSHCAGLCCVAPAFTASADFAIDKPPGRPCPNLQPDFRCRIHRRLRAAGFTGCAVFDCFGAGQRVSTVTFPGLDWRDSPELADRMFRAFAVLRQVHEMLWYLDDAAGRPQAAVLHGDLLALRDGLEELASGAPEQVLALDVDAHRVGVNGLLLQVSALVRAAAGSPGPDRRRADLAGARLAGADLARADLRGADLAGADLREALFLTQPQVEAAHGDGRTRLPRRVNRPSHWAG